ncbi:hypothetical protein, partial [uncultured Sutterella sp.]|uniref:hypothetical protein n=1 Tax=uncultured Sutterella sp. TaxID=286133 RepID=UPI0025F0944F
DVVGQVLAEVRRELRHQIGELACECFLLHEVFLLWETLVLIRLDGINRSWMVVVWLFPRQRESSYPMPAVYVCLLYKSNIKY